MSTRQTSEIRLGQRLRELRGAAGATQFDVERLIGINHTRISLAECGHVQLREEEYLAVERALLEVTRERAAQFTGILEREEHFAEHVTA